MTEPLNEQEKYWVSISWTKPDSRLSAIATATGVWVFFSFLPLLLVFILDLSTFYWDLRMMQYNITGDEKYKPKRKIKKPKPGNPKENTNAMQEVVTMQAGVNTEDPGEGTSCFQDTITTRE